LEFHSLQQYNHYNEKIQQLHRNVISQEEFDHDCRISLQTFEKLKQNISEWSNLWDVKIDGLFKIKDWHGKVSIEAMFGMLNEDSNAWRIYGVFCHGTHLSPSARRMINGLRLIGFSRLPNGKFDLRPVENLVAI
jgi:hypothetical protein